MTGNPRKYYMGIGKNGSSKRSRNLAGFPGFSKKPARTPTHRRKRSLAKPHKPTRPINTAFKKTLPQKYGQHYTANKKGRQIRQPFWFR
jgi:hypothetical protein